MRPGLRFLGLIRVSPPALRAHKHPLRRVKSRSPGVGTLVGACPKSCGPEGSPSCEGLCHYQMPTARARSCYFQEPATNHPTLLLFGFRV